MKYLFVFFGVLNLAALKGQEIMAKGISDSIRGVKNQKQLIVKSLYSKDYSLLPIKATRTITITTNEGSSMDVDISPDESKILFTLLGEIFVMPANGGRATQLTKGMAINTYPVWSPNGNLIAYVSDASGE